MIISQKVRGAVAVLVVRLSSAVRAVVDFVVGPARALVGPLLPSLEGWSYKELIIQAVSLSFPLHLLPDQ